MRETWSAFARRLTQMDTRKLVGLGLQEARKIAPELSVLYADVGKRFGLEGFIENGGFCLDTGIAEQSMVGVSAGMRGEGIPVAVISYAPFLTGRAFDQIRANAGEMGLPLLLIGSPSGLSAGGLGPLSTCIDDIALMRSIPGMRIVSPADGVEALKCFRAAVREEHPTYIRMTGKTMAQVYRSDYDFRIGKAVRLREGERVVVVSAGAVTSRVLEAVDALKDEGHPVAVLNMHTVAPLDAQALRQYLSFDAMVTVEEHRLCGGMGDAVAAFLAGYGRHPRLLRLGLDGPYEQADRYEALMEKAGLTAERIHETLKGLCMELTSRSSTQPNGI